MIDEDLRFCPRCGNSLVPGEPYCPKCGFHAAGIARSSASETADMTTRTDPGLQRAPDEPVRPEVRRMYGSRIILAAVIVAAGLIGYALLTRPGASPETANPASGGSGSVAGASPVASSVASAPIIGMTIESPRDGEQVSTKEVTVIGLAPPGIKITRDISFFPDPHATADSTGHWAIAVSLNEGNNDLVFRIGDDRSTDQRIRITYTPSAR